MNKFIDDLDTNIERAARSYKRSDDGRWASAFYSARIVGKYQYGGTLKLAQRLGVSVDTVEDLAHAYWLYDEFRSVEKYRVAVRAIRKMPYIYYSYFRALYDAKDNYHLTLEQVWEMLVDILQGEGSIRLADLDVLIRDNFGDTRDWSFWGQRAMKAIHNTLQRPDIPTDVKEALVIAYEALGREA